MDLLEMVMRLHDATAALEQLTGIVRQSPNYKKARENIALVENALMKISKDALAGTSGVRWMPSE